ncbi:hypothetical protein BC834DRAFT_966495 [Gloeopeniophorella convolvens]|nr:hypothetical protein BC834DRAFT_966495 [Gloeopeniophorella convolvens]
MDDLWGNAWGGPGHDDERKPSSWSSPAKPQNEDEQEDDLAIPSWSTGTDIRWDEPTHTQSPLWSQPQHATDSWSLDDNPYSDIPLGASHSAQSPVDDTIAVEPSGPPSPLEPSDNFRVSPPPVSVVEESSPSEAPPSPRSSRTSTPPSPDAFGTFTTGAESEDPTPWNAADGIYGGNVESNSWGSAWGNAPEEAEDGDGQQVDDEWEAAKRRQLEMDRRVPPELLSYILLQVDELSKDAWAEPPENEHETDWQRRWQSGMDVDGLDYHLIRYIPSLTLPQPPTFGKTFSAKSMANAVKLSRNSSLARTSPMATFLAAKGSTAWETSVKSRVEVFTDDVPSGWRILDKEFNKDEKPEEKVKKPAGLLASLWGRRGSAAPGQPLSAAASNPSSAAHAQERTTSIEASKPSPRSSTEALSGTKSASQTPSEPTASPAPAQSQTTPVSTSTPEPSSPHTFIQDEDAPASSAPSAVSRFLNRFSRSRTSSSRNSLALSTDDLEFLSDVTTTSVDSVEPLGGQLIGMETTSGPSREKLLLPLPPPPSSAALSPSSLVAPSRGSSRNESSLISDALDSDIFSDLETIVDDTPIPALSPRPPSGLLPFEPSLGPDKGSSLLSIFQDNGDRSRIHQTKGQSPVPFHPALSLNVSILPSTSAQHANVPLPSFPPSDQQEILPLSQDIAQSMNGTHNDDDFSDFHSSPAGPPPPSSFLTSSISAPAVGHVALSHPHGPPKPTDKPSATQPMKNFNTVSPAASSEQLPRLVERAAARPGRWPAPPSPLPEALSPPPAPAQSSSVGVNILGNTPTELSFNFQQPPPPRKGQTLPQRPSMQGHQRTQSLLELAASRPGHWPAPPSPLPDALPPPPPPPGKTGDKGILNADFFGNTPTEDTFALPPVPAAIRASLPPSLGKPASASFSLPAASPSTSSTTGARPPSRASSPMITPPVSGFPGRRAFSPPPATTAIMSKLPPKASTPVPLLPPPGGFGFVAPPKASTPQYSPESTPLALLMDNSNGVDSIGSGASVPSMKAPSASPPAVPIKGAGGLTAQDLSFFEGL